MIQTARLILRPWRDSDLPAFAEQNADPVVMRYLLHVLTRSRDRVAMLARDRPVGPVGPADRVSETSEVTLTPYNAC